jgi:hypothetical protein
MTARPGRFVASRSNGGYVRDEFTGHRQTAVATGPADDDEAAWTDADFYQARHGHDTNEWWEDK